MKVFEILLLLALAVFPFGQIATIPFGFLGFPAVRLHLLDLLAFGIVICWLGRKVSKKEKIPQTPLAKPILVFSGLALLSLLINTPLLGSREILVSFLYFLRFVVYAGVFLAVFDFYRKDKMKKNLILKSLILVGAVSAVLALFQYFFFPDVRQLSYASWDPHYYRAVGTFLDPTFLGIILVLTLILVSFKLWEKKGGWLYLAGIVTYIGLALTYSRASYLAFLVGAGFISFFKKAPKFFFGALLLLVVTILVLPRPGGEGVKLERESTIKARIANWQQSLKIARDHPLLGVGFNSYRYAQKRYGFLSEEDWRVSHAGAGADSSLLFVLATTGIFGFLAYLWLWVKILRKASPLVFTSGAALLAHSFFSNSLFYPFIMFWLWVLVESLSVEE